MHTRLWQYVDACTARIEMAEIVEADGVEITRKGAQHVCKLREDERTASAVVYRDHLFDYGDWSHHTPYSWLRGRRGLDHWTAIDALAQLGGMPPFDRALADRPARIDPQEAFDALPETLPETERTPVLRAVVHAIATLDDIDRGTWIDRVVARYGAKVLKRATLEKMVKGASKEAHANIKEALRQNAPGSSTEFVIHEGCLAVKAESGKATPLCNFDARITRYLQRGDAYVYEVSGTLADGTLLGIELIPADDFAACKWIDARWPGAVVRNGKAIRDMVREAIQTLSGVPARGRIHTQIGWTTIDGERRYVHAGGVVGSGGTHLVERRSLPAVTEQAELDIDLACCKHEFPTGAATTEEIHHALKLQYAFIPVAPGEVTVPMHALDVSGPLSEVLGNTYTLLLIGEPGAMKSSLAVQIQRRWGSRYRTDKDLPANFESTKVGIEGILEASVKKRDGSTFPSAPKKSMVRPSWFDYRSRYPRPTSRASWRSPPSTTPASKRIFTCRQIRPVSAAFAQ